MVRFCCEHCGRKISVQDKYIGKRGECPECSAIVVIPAKSTVIEFHCQNCDRKISVPRTRAGKEAQCPNCKDRFIVPATDFESSPAKQSPPAQSTASAGALTVLDVPEEYKLKDPPAGRSEKAIVSEPESEGDGAEEEKEPVGERKLPWFMDIFLYPTSAPGLIHLGIFTIIPLLIAIVRIPLGIFGMAIGIPGFLINVLISLYLCWYVTECVRDSAKGGTRAPEAFATADLGEMWSQAQHIIGCYLILLGPVFFYSLFAHRTDVVFWILLGYGILFFPMGLLATVMFDSIRGLNPILLLGSIFSTFFQYCGLLLLIGGTILIFRSITTMESSETQQPTVTMLILGGVFYAIALYSVFVVAHLLGRFYWRNQEKLNWEV